ncbi:hypothetical protein HCUR_00587 [Holospora curviuscula]|uniref:Uncharacterized protein n=1 Tax=Holospora curviuscula TaxID=1082868 RepID=A0A2S5RA37_9PROT|nr:hypothetical protein HCUR_00587 [Holospora curviuscula]
MADERQRRKNLALLKAETTEKLKKERAKIKEQEKKFKKEITQAISEELKIKKYKFRAQKQQELLIKAHTNKTQKELSEKLKKERTDEKQQRQEQFIQMKANDQEEKKQTVSAQKQKELVTKTRIKKIQKNASLLLRTYGTDEKQKRRKEFFQANVQRLSENKEKVDARRAQNKKGVTFNTLDFKENLLEKFSKFATELQPLGTSNKNESTANTFNQTLHSLMDLEFIQTLNKPEKLSIVPSRKNIENLLPKIQRLKNGTPQEELDRFMINNQQDDLSSENLFKKDNICTPQTPLLEDSAVAKKLCRFRDEN